MIELTFHFWNASTINAWYKKKVDYDKEKTKSSLAWVYKWQRIDESRRRFTALADLSEIGFPILLFEALAPNQLIEWPK